MVRTTSAWPSQLQILLSFFIEFATAALLETEADASAHRIWLETEADASAHRIC
jgi:hypothetical protein